MLDEAQRQLNALWPVPDVTHLTPERCRQLNDVMWRFCHECQRYGDMETQWVEIALLMHSVCRVPPHTGPIVVGPLTLEPPSKPPPWWDVAAKIGYCSLEANRDCESVWGFVEVPTPKGPVYIDLHAVCLAAMFGACMAT
jgi:hypothetical protein